MRRALLVAALLVGPPLLAGPAAPATPGDLAMKVVPHAVKVTTRKDGTVTSKLEPLAKLRPGDDIMYVIFYDNRGGAPLERAIIAIEVPADVAAVPGSAEGPGSEPEWSSDGGRTWRPGAEPPRPSADGAAAPRITHLRWKLAAPVFPGQDGRVWYRARFD